MRKESLREWLFSLIEACVVVLVMYFICWPVNIDGISMEKTFQTGDKAFISKILVILNKLEYGDIIVCSITKTDGKNEKVVKRVIGLPGDHISINNGIVTRNGVLLDESYAQGVTYGEIDLEIPDGHIFILGDNRERSLDSRELGSISLEKADGKLIFRFFPFNKLQSY